MTIAELRALARKLNLEHCAVADKYTDGELGEIYNGIGPERFPEALRKAVSALHPSLAVAAFIHDIEWHESDGLRSTFSATNGRFKRNGYAAAKAAYGWYNPLRYVVMNQARRFGNLCQHFGWSGYVECFVAKEARR